MAQAPLRDVVEVREFEGPRGGKKFVHRLSCGCLVWRSAKRPAKQVRCVSCWWRECDVKVRDEALENLETEAGGGRAAEELRDIIELQRRVIQGLMAGLRRYGRHTALCGITGGYGECTCGLSAALGEDVAVGEPREADGDAGLDEEP